MTTPRTGLQLTSTLAADGTLTLELAETPVRPPEPGEVVVRIEAAPINPSDIVTLLATADPEAAAFAGTPDRPRVTAKLSPGAVRGRANRIGVPFAVGLEGAGEVIAAGERSEPLLGRTVAVMAPARGMFAHYVTVAADACVPLPDGTAAVDGADAFVNPLTVLAMLESRRIEAYAGLVHTAAASNLGRMLVKVCLEDGVPLVNVVRRPEQAELLRGLGATHVCDTSAPTYREELAQALADTRANLVFDAIGGGRLGGDILAAIERAAAARATQAGPYGSGERKQLYVYGRLDRSPMELRHEAFGPVWGVNGWTMTDVLAQVGPDRTQALQRRVVAGLKGAFASRYGREISLAEALRRDVMLAYCRRATGEKYLIRPFDLRGRHV